MDLLVPHECQRCGVVDEAQFTFSGPHIKQICNACGCYVKFFDKSKIPDAGETKLRIWALTTDLSVIGDCKNRIGFVDDLTGTNKKIMYWRLYLKVRETKAKWEAAL